MKKQIFLCFAVLAAAISLAGIANGYPLTAALNSMQVVPPHNSTTRGSCRISASDYQGMLIDFDVNCDFSGLSGPLTDADVRFGRAGQNGDGVCDSERRVMVTLPNNGSGSMSIFCRSGWWVDNFSTKEFYVVLQTSNFPNGEIRGQIKPAFLDSDVDGEGRAEISVFRPENAMSYAYCSMMNSTIYKQLSWNALTDSPPFLADFDGDAIADWAFARTNPQNGNMSVSYTSSRSGEEWGWGWGNATLGDSYVFGDYNGNGTIDVAVFRSSNGNWYVTGSTIFGEHWGQIGDTPCAGDYDGDGKTDLCVVRPVDGQFVWNIRRSSDHQLYIVTWGLTTDTIYPRNPVNVDGDDRTDILVSRVENGQRTFYALRSSDNSLYALQWGLSTDAVKLGDYDNDGMTDFAAIREIDGHLVWFIHQSSDGQMRVNYWGLPGDN